MQADNTIVGVAIILFTSSIILLNLLVIRAISKDKELFRLNSYKLMLGLAFSDTIQMVVHFITGFFTIFQAAWHPLNKAMGAIACYKFYAVLNLVLAINRLVTVCSPHTDAWLFSKRGMKLWFLGALSVALCFAISNSSPLSSKLFYPELWSWHYDKSMPMSWLVSLAAEVVDLGFIFTAGALYVLIFFIIIRKRTTFQLRRKNSLTDLKILIQAFTITVYCTVMNIFFYNYQILLPDTKLAYTALNFMDIGNSAVNPLIYFAVNAAIRQKAKASITLSRVHSLRMGEVKTTSTIASVALVSMIKPFDRSNPPCFSVGNTAQRAP